MDANDKGKLMEQFAQQYLIQQGLIFIDKNIHCRQGELDLIFNQGSIWVFVEVKYRKNSSFGGALSAVSAAKQQKIRSSIAYYLQQKKLNEYNTPCRIDVISLEGDLNKPKINWIKNAF